MKKYIAIISRITISYGKLLLTILFLSSNSMPLNAEEAFTYLKCGSNYLRLSGTYLGLNYNVRTKKFMKFRKISKYGEVYIYAGGYRLNRDTGEIVWGSNSKDFCEKIDFNELPKLNAEGKSSKW